VPERCWCWGSWTELRRESFEVDGDSGAGDATRPFSREGRRDAAEARETDGLCKVGTGGGFEQTWSPSSESGTGKLQLEHLTEGKSWDMRAGEFVGAGERREAIMVETIVGVYLSRPALIVLCRQGSNVAASVQGGTSRIVCRDMQHGGKMQTSSWPSVLNTACLFTRSQSVADN
jgi:hypothetical protein